MTAPGFRSIGGNFSFVCFIVSILASQARADLPEVAEGFEIRLFAAVPAATFPCQVGAAPDGSLFVAEDPMDQVGPFEADNGRIVRFAPGPDGKLSPDNPTVFADNLRAVFGMAWHDGALYVMHMPYLSVFRDTDGDGKADQRKDVFKDLGPGPNALNDHIVSGLQFGMDGWLYISVGDKGVPGATRPEDGQKVVLKGGGTLRCRPDGTRLEVISSGTRNHLEPNLDSRDNLFTYDNTDDGDGWWTRVTHHMDGAYFGYAYDYHKNRHRMLDRIEEYGGGSPCGGVVYKDDAWPAKYRDMAFWAEWGKREVRGFRFDPKGASFAVGELVTLVKPGKVESFRPIDLALSADGTTMYIADWSMGGWNNKTEKLGRIYAVTPKEIPSERVVPGLNTDTLADTIRRLSHPAFSARMNAQNAIIAKGYDKATVQVLQTALATNDTPALAKRHLIWTLEGIAGGGPDATMPILDRLENDPDEDVRSQAARAMGLRQAAIANDPLIKALADKSPVVRLQALIALGRLGDASAVKAIVPQLGDSDPYIAFAARVALRRIGDFETAAEIGLASTDSAVRKGMLFTLEQQYDLKAAEALAAYAADSSKPAEERAMAVTYLAQIDKKYPAWDGSWWGTRPTRGKIPQRELPWEGSDFVVEQLRQRLADPSHEVRLAAIATVIETRDARAVETLRERLQADKDTLIRLKLIDALAALKDTSSVAAIAALANDAEVAATAMAALGRIGADASTNALLEKLLSDKSLALSARIAALKALTETSAKSPAEKVLPKLAELARPDEPSPVRSAVIALLAEFPKSDVTREEIRKALGDKVGEVVKAALAAAAKTKDTESVPALVRLANEAATRYEAMAALAELPDVRAARIYLTGLTERNPQLRRSSAAAIAKIREEALPVLEQLAARKELPSTALVELRKIFERPVPVKDWRIAGPFGKGDATSVDPAASIDYAKPLIGRKGATLNWKQQKTEHPEGMVDLAALLGGDNDVFALSTAEVTSPVARRANLVVGSDDTMTVWLNGVQVYDFKSDRGWQADADTVAVNLKQGTNLLIVKCGNSGGGWQFSVGVTEPGDYAFLKGPAPGQFDSEEFRKKAGGFKGDAGRGQKLFADVNGLACVKCHAVGGQGGAVGPDLTGIAVKYTPDEIAASILYPSAKIASGYESQIIATHDGRILTGVLKNESPEAIEIEDADAKRVRIPAGDIEARRPADVSIMPNGLAEGLQPKDFADLMAYLATLKEAAKADAGKAPTGGGN
jgi:putative membrane-bound dehydrogenase-like protein